MSPHVVNRRTRIRTVVGGRGVHTIIPANYRRIRLGLPTGLDWRALVVSRDILDRWHCCRAGRVFRMEV